MRFHLTGVSFRTIANEFEVGVATAYRHYRFFRDKLPHCTDITRSYCSKFCGILLVDGKYIRVKGFERKIPVIYGIDYLTHDIPNYIFSIAENYQTCLSFFSSLRLLNYPLQAVVSDDNLNIYEAAKFVYPRVITQLCHHHYQQTIRLSLGINQDPTYRPFVEEIAYLFGKRRSETEFNSLAGKLVYRWGKDQRLMSILVDMQRRLPMLTAYMKQKHIPRTTNLIESFNSHLEGRLKTIKKFESFKQADLWLNAYFIKRRLTPFKDCGKRFRYLNGKCSLSKTIKDQSKIKDLLRLFR